MDKFVILSCIEPAAYYRLYSQCKDIAYQCAFTECLDKLHLSHTTLNMVAYPMAMRNYLQVELMHQPMKAKSYEESMDILWNFLWDYFYPLENIFNSLSAGKQFVFIHVLDIQSHIDKIMHHIIYRLEEHNYINVAGSSLIKLYIGDSRNVGDYSYNHISGKLDFADMFYKVKDLVKCYIDSHVDVIIGKDDNYKPFTYARLKDAASLYDAPTNSWFEEILPKNQRREEAYEQTESSVC